MNRIIRIASIAVLLMAVMATGCNKTPDQTVKKAELQLVISPQVYGAFQGPETRAHNLGDNYNDFPVEPPTVDLPVGSTVWLTYRKGTPINPSGNLEDPANFNWGAPDLQAYVVQKAAGYNALYPIASHIETIDGIQALVVTEPVNYSNPLFLEEGYYQFRMVTPAYPIKADNLAMQVDNGMFLYANDERYNQTRSIIKHIVTSGNSGVINVVLNPIIAETARIKITLERGTNVLDLEMMSQGIEISGLQNPEMTPEGHLDFKWTSMDIRDTLEMKRGDKHARVFITDFEEDENGHIIGEAAILPTNSMSTICYILINMAVNGVPTQYVLTLTQMKFVHGHSYDLDLHVGVNGDITVMSWANQAWTGEVTLN